MDSTDEKRLCQFNVRVLLYIMTATACVFAIGRALPLEVRHVVISGAVLVFTPFIAYPLLAELDRVFFRKEMQSSAVGSFVLVSACTTVSLVVLAAAWMGVAGRSGPIQYAVGNRFAMLFYLTRCLVILLLLASPFVSGVIGMIRSKWGRTSRPGWVIAGVTSFAIAWKLVMSYAFFPTA